MTLNKTKTQPTNNSFSPPTNKKYIVLTLSLLFGEKIREKDFPLKNYSADSTEC